MTLSSKIPSSMKVGAQKIGWVIGIGILLFVLIIGMIGQNEAGFRTVIQTPFGGTSVKFSPGPYIDWYGYSWTYPDVISFDYDKSQGGRSTIEQLGIKVRYQDGGEGTIFGLARFSLSNDETMMLATHTEFRSAEGLAFKLLKVVTEETMNHTAGLMSSEQSYAEMRGTFAQWARIQMEKGKFRTAQKRVVTTEVGFEFCLEVELTPEQKLECREIKKVTKMVPVIAMQDGTTQMHLPSDLTQYGITLSGFQMVDWGYEAKTLDQIASKRDATMKIITAKANAERAKQDTITEEQEGLARVMKARYDKEVDKKKAIVEAQQRKEVAEIEAAQLVTVATQKKAEAEQLKLGAKEYKEEQVLRGEGDASYKQLVMNADGALAQKLDAYVEVNRMYADAIGHQKWVPEISMNGGGSGDMTSAQTLIDLFMTKTARDLSLDLNMEVKRAEAMPMPIY